MECSPTKSLRDMESLIDDDFEVIERDVQPPPADTSFPDTGVLPPLLVPTSVVSIIDRPTIQSVATTASTSTLTPRVTGETAVLTQSLYSSTSSSGAPTLNGIISSLDETTRQLKSINSAMTEMNIMSLTTPADSQTLLRETLTTQYATLTTEMAAVQEELLAVRKESEQRDATAAADKARVIEQLMASRDECEQMKNEKRQLEAQKERLVAEKSMADKERERLAIMVREKDAQIGVIANQLEEQKKLSDGMLADKQGQIANLAALLEEEKAKIHSLATPALLERTPSFTENNLREENRYMKEHIEKLQSDLLTLREQYSLSTAHHVQKKEEYEYLKAQYDSLVAHGRVPVGQEYNTDVTKQLMDERQLTAKLRQQIAELEQRVKNEKEEADTQTAIVQAMHEENQEGTRIIAEDRRRIRELEEILSRYDQTNPF